MFNVADQLRRWWGPWLGAATLCTGLAMHWLVEASALPIDALSAQSLVLGADDGEWLHVRVQGDHYRLAPLSPVSDTYLDLLMAYEDRDFYRHRGIDWSAIGRAAINNLRSGRVVSGASTLTMQVSRLLRPHARSLTGKLSQAMGALWLERHYTKSEILNAYLTLAPFGANVEGIEMASRYWLNKPPQQLSHAEAALLVALPQRPARHRPDRYPVIAKAARDRVLRKGFESGLLTRQAYLDATHSPLPTRVNAFAQSDHHLADRAQLAGLQGWVATTVQRALQAEVQALVGGWPLAATDNISVLVVDRAGRLRAHVGSRGYFGAGNKGAVDFSTAVRSPGSTLKPLIYALAETQGVLRFESVYNDRARDFGGYAPDNFDKTDKGAQTFGDALAQSHNRAAVDALRRLTPAVLDAQFAGAGVALHGQVVLAAAVGGVGVPLESLASLYTAFINQGRVAPVHWRAQSAAPAQVLISPRASARTNYYLRRVALPNGVPRSSTLNAFALKTGTGPRGSDTLAMLYTADYVVAVWVGSPDNRPRPNRTGLQSAAPIALAVRDLLPLGDALGYEAPGPVIAVTEYGPTRMDVVFPQDQSELAFPRDRQWLRPTLANADYPVDVILNGLIRQRLETPRDPIKFPSSGFWRLGFNDANQRTASARVRVW